MLQCPNCGGNLKFSPSAQKLNCEHCNSQFNPYSFDEKTQDAEERELFDVTVFTCPQCGGEILSTDHAAAGFCSFCGASAILYSRISRERRPRYIIPFCKTKEDCKKAYKKMMSRAVFAPGELKDEKCIDSFRGIYMPYWSYDIVQQGQVNLKGKKEHRRGDYIITKHFSLSGEVDSRYDGMYYDASSSFEDRISENLAPYNSKEREAFTPGFLSGFYADIPDVGAEVYENEIRQKIQEENLSRIKKTPVFQSYRIENSKNTGALPEVRVTSRDAAMFPVWFMSYRKKDRVIYAAVNGQTGKVAADLPIDSKKYIIGSLLLAVPIFILLNLWLVLTPASLLIGISLLSLLTLFIYAWEAREIKNRESRAGDRGFNWVKNQRNEKKPVRKTTSGKSEWKGFPGSLAAFIVSVLVLLFSPVSDIYYYGAAIFSLLAICCTIVSMIHAYNLLSTHRPPQFDKQGGDDRA